MTGHGTIMESLREVGYRLTPQRILIISIIHDSEEHITAEEIHNRIAKQYPCVDISTVYRTLQLLKKLHLVSETDLGGGVQYELSAGSRHHHLVCRQCRESFDLDDEALEPLRASMLDQYGFRADMDHFAIFGLCKQCQSQAAEGGGKDGPD